MTAATAVPPISARWRARMPPTTSVAPRMIVRTIVDARSGSFMIRNAKKTNTNMHRAQRLAPVVDLALLAGEDVGGEHEERELRDLRRLHAPRAEPEPAARAVDPDADAGNEHQHEQHRREREERDGVPAPRACSRCATRPRSPTMPRPVHSSWRSKNHHALPLLSSDCTEDAESTITTPMTFSTATTISSSR